MKEWLKEISKALLGSGIDVSDVMKLRKNIMKMLKIEGQERGNIRVFIKSAVVKELTELLEVEKKVL
jgi:signal recognition particle GTPase